MVGFSNKLVHDSYFKMEPNINLGDVNVLTFMWIQFASEPWEQSLYA